MNILVSNLGLLANEFKDGSIFLVQAGEGKALWMRGGLRVLFDWCGISMGAGLARGGKWLCWVAILVEEFDESHTIDYLNALSICPAVGARLEVG